MHRAIIVIRQRDYHPKLTVSCKRQERFLQGLRMFQTWNQGLPRPIKTEMDMINEALESRFVWQVSDLDMMLIWFPLLRE
jgi:hypothetical protein